MKHSPIALFHLTCPMKACLPVTEAISEHLILFVLLVVECMCVTLDPKVRSSNREVISNDGAMSDCLMDKWCDDYGTCAPKLFIGPYQTKKIGIVCLLLVSC